MAAAERGVIDQAMALVAQLEDWERARHFQLTKSATEWTPSETDTTHFEDEGLENDSMSEEDAAHHLKELKQASQSVREMAEVGWEL